jgi:hypothetical protein
VCVWKCHKDTSAIAILNKQKCHFFFFYKIGEQEGRTGPVWRDWYQWEGGGSGERVWEGEFSADCAHINGKIIPVETISGMGGRGIKENCRGGKCKHI